jgi:hypothetical protein
VLLLLLSDSVHEQTGLDQRADPIEKSGRRPVAVLAAEERPGLADDQIRRQHLLGAAKARQHCDRHPMTGVTG